LILLKKIHNQKVIQNCLTLNYRAVLQ